MRALRLAASLRQQIADALRASIVGGQMASGEVYSAPALAERYGVSVTPVREALLDLAKDGLVEPVRNKGFRVVVPEAAELDAMSDVRLLLEPVAAHRVAALPDAARPAALAGMRELARDVVSAAETGDVVAHLRADRAFHARLLELAGNPVLTETVLRLRDRSRLYGLEGLAQAGLLTGSAAEHEVILDLVLAGDAAGAAAAVRRHLAHVRTDWSATPR